MTALAEALSQQAGRPVVDQTTLAGLFDFELDFAPAPVATTDAVPPAAGAAPFVTALREQLGLRLDSASAPLDVLVIDSIEPPADN